MNKILVVTSYFYPDIGGVANHTYNLYKYLSKYSENKIVIISSGKKYTTNYMGKLKVIRLPYLFKISMTPVNPLWLFQIRAIIKYFKPDIILVHIPVVFMADIAALVCGNIPLIVKYHHGGSMVKGKFLPDILISLYEKTLLKHLFKRVKLIISASEYVSKNYLFAYKEKVLTITSGVDLNKFKPKYYKPKENILFVANLNKSERYKGLEYLLDAFPLIKERIPKATLTIVGDGDELTYYKNIATILKINTDVLFKGRVIGKDLVKLYQESGVVVLPSLVESSPNVLLEAMACGKPIAGSDTKGISDIIFEGKNGYLFEPKNPANIAVKVVRILSDKKMSKKMGAKGYKIARDKYSWDKKAKMTQSAINDVLQYL